MPETPADRLRKAADRVRDGHTIGSLCDEYGDVCALGAILDLRDNEYIRIYRRETTAAHALLARDDVATQAAVTLSVFLDPEAGTKTAAVIETIEMWNDQDADGGDEVAEVMEKAAARWEEQGNA